jgi:outer membrane receptor protein involved in Fe transport
VFARYLHTFVNELPVWDPGASDANILTTGKMGRDRTALAKSFVLATTVVFGPSMVNAVRVAYNATAIKSVRAPWVDAPALGINTYTAFPGKIVLSVTGGFSIGHPSGVNSDLWNHTYQASDDLTIVKGRHQLGVGASYAYWFSHQELNARSPGSFTFNGSLTGLGLTDFLSGQLFRLEQSDPQILDMDQTYIGLYGQDAWRATDRVTVNAGVRWEPFFGQNVTRGSISNFSVDRFRAGVKSKVFVNAPAGLLLPG